jgi:hypothetical protein
MSGDAQESLAVLDDNWFVPARTALARGMFRRLDVVANDRCFRIAGRAGWRFWRRVAGGSTTSHAMRSPQRHNRDMDVVIERRAIARARSLDTRLHPCCGAPTRRAACATARSRADTRPAGAGEHARQHRSAVRLILEHRERRILVVGDFDADGATSTALIVRCLRAGDSRRWISWCPNRFEFGYGLTPEIVGWRASARRADRHGGQRISSIAACAAARARGIQVLITDHHCRARPCPPPMSS